MSLNAPPAPATSSPVCLPLRLQEPQILDKYTCLKTRHMAIEWLHSHQTRFIGRFSGPDIMVVPKSWTYNGCRLRLDVSYYYFIEPFPVLSVPWGMTQLIETCADPEGFGYGSIEVGHFGHVKVEILDPRFWQGEGNNTSFSEQTSVGQKD